MNKMLYLLLLLIIISCTNHSVDPEEIQSYSNDSLLSDSLKAILYSDAQNMEFEIMQKNETIYNTMPWLDEDNVQKHYNDFITIYSIISKIDTNFIKYSRAMHFSDSKYLTESLVAVDTNKIWVKNWLNGKQESGIKKIDNVIKQFNLKVVEIEMFFSDLYTFELLSPIPMNLNVPINLLEQTNEFNYTSINSAYSFIPNPVLVDAGKTRTYLFSYGWGDCPSGCIHMHTWQIKVNDDKVLQVLESGEPIE